MHDDQDEKYTCLSSKLPGSTCMHGPKEGKRHAYIGRDYVQSLAGSKGLHRHHKAVK